EGVDMFGRKVERHGLAEYFRTCEAELVKAMGMGRFNTLMTEVMEEYKDRLQVHMDKENDLNVNEEIDNAWNGAGQAPDLDADCNSAWADFFHTQGVVDEAQARHDRMVMRLAIVD